MRPVVRPVAPKSDFARRGLERFALTRTESKMAKMIRTATLGLLLGLAAPAMAVSARAADDYPQRAVTFICPFPAGGATDILTRMLAQELQDELKQPFVVENRTGAGTLIAAEAVAKSAPDGYTLLLAPVTTLAIGPSVYKSLPYDTVKDFAPVGLVGAAEFALVANPSLGATTLPELIALIRSRPGELSYGSAGRSTPHHLFMEMFLKMIGTEAQHVPYRGSQPALTDVVAGRIQMMMVDLAVGIPMIEAGKVTAYGVTSATRDAAVPDIPTIAEAGLPGYAASGWFSVVARAGTPRATIDKLSAVLTAYLKRPDVAARLATLAINPLTSTPDELERYIPAEIDKWARVVKAAGITPE